MISTKKLQPVEKGRIGYLDSSRGLAALAVVLAHFQLTFLPGWTDSTFMHTPLAFIFDAESAVLYFFILSGFVLTLSIKNTESISLRSYFRFLIRRFFRIYPAFIFTLLIAFIIFKLIDDRPDSWLSKFWQEDFNIISLIKQSVLVKRFPNDPGLRLLPHDWTLSIEAAISFLLPLLAFLSFKNPYLVLILIYCSAKFLSLDPFVFDFALGVFVASFRNKLIPFFSKRNVRIPLILISILLISGSYLSEEFKKIDHLLIHHKSWGLVMLFCILLSSKKMQHLLSFSPVVFLGKISYSVYLIHFIILIALNAFVEGWSPLAVFLTYMVLTILISTIMYYRIEKPFLTYSKLVTSA